MISQSENFGNWEKWKIFLERKYSNWNCPIILHITSSAPNHHLHSVEFP